MPEESTAERPRSGLRRLFRRLVLWTTLPLPWFLKRPALSLLLGYELDRRAKIGLAIVDAQRVRMGKGSVIRHLAVVRDLELLEMGEFSSIGTMCWVSAHPRGDAHFAHVPERRLELRMGSFTILTSRHYIDCTDAVTIGDYTMLAGGYSQVLTHEISVDEGRQRTEPVSIGDHTLIHTRCVVVAGTRIPDQVVIAAGAVVRGELEGSHALYGGLPARKLRDIDPHAGFFTLELDPE
jgi:acetyltransferase-like isoleucine patch superfamily enzyme